MIDNHKGKIGSHIHGCGHPVRPVVICDDPVCTICGMMDYLDWKDDHAALIAAGKPCICYFCWKDKTGRA